MSKLSSWCSRKGPVHEVSIVDENLIKKKNQPKITQRIDGIIATPLIISMLNTSTSWGFHTSITINS